MSQTANISANFGTPDAIVTPDPVIEPPSVLDFTGRTLTVPVGVTGPAQLTLDIAWSDFDNENTVRRGCRIQCGGTGFAVAVSDPQYQSPVLDVIIATLFPTATYSGSDIVLLLPVEVDPVRFVPNPFRYQTHLLPDYFGGVREAVVNDVCDAIVRLGNLRQWDKIDAEYLDLAKQQLGGYFDTVMFDDEARRRVLLELPNFYTYNATERYIQFLSYLLGILFTMKPLWTRDYKNFIPDDGTLTAEYYPTNHLMLAYDAALYPPPDMARLTSLFYDLSPTPFVLQYVYAVLTARRDFTISAYFHAPTVRRVITNAYNGLTPDQIANPVNEPMA